jgi:hypothetical protein
MATLFLRRTLAGFAPADAASEEGMKRYKPGNVCRAEIVQPRNYRHHCLFMSLLALTYDNQEAFTDPQSFRRAVAFEAGHVKEFQTLEGEILKVPLSYSYDELPDESEFNAKFGAAMEVCAKVLHNTDRDELAREVERYADEHYGRAA